VVDLFEQMQRDSETAIQNHIFESVDAAQLAFDEGLLGVALLSDESAFSLVRESMEYMYSNGDFERVQRMAMEIGAMACMHDHMQEFSSQTSEKFGDILLGSNNHSDNDGHEHSAKGLKVDDDDEYEWVNGKKKRKKRKGKN
jgi:hypothetical protein